MFVKFLNDCIKMGKIFTLGSTPMNVYYIHNGHTEVEESEEDMDPL